MKNIFFNSSMPRACSTLCQNIIGQNPLFYVTPTSGLLELLFSAQVQYTSSAEFRAQDSALMEAAWLGFCRSGMNGYFESITDKPYIVDKSRGWHMKHSFLERIQGRKPKTISMVRDLKSIIASMEKLHRQTEELKTVNIVDHSKMFGTTTAKRVDVYLSSPPVGLALERFSETILKGWAEYICFVRAEDLTARPEIIMNRIYDYLEVPRFNHDYQNVKQITKEDDEVYGLGNKSLHIIRENVMPLVDDSEEILGKDICKWIDENPSFEFYRRAFGYGNWKFRGDFV